MATVTSSSIFTSSSLSNPLLFWYVSGVVFVLMMIFLYSTLFSNINYNDDGCQLDANGNPIHEIYKTSNSNQIGAHAQASVQTGTVNNACQTRWDNFQTAFFISLIIGAMFGTFAGKMFPPFERFQYGSAKK